MQIIEKLELELSRGAASFMSLGQLCALAGVSEEEAETAFESALGLDAQTVMECYRSGVTARMVLTPGYVSRPR